MVPELRAYRDSIDPEFVVNTLVTSLGEDPHAPKHCALCLLGCLLTLSHRDLGWDNITARQYHYHQWYDTCIRFLTVSRPEGEHQRLREQMAKCDCNLSDARIRTLHENGRLHGRAKTYPELGRMLGWEVHNVLQPVRETGKIHKVARNQERAAREGKKLPWPATPPALLPFGIDESIAAIGNWVEQCPELVWLGLLASLIDIFKQPLIKSLLQNPTLPGKIVGIGEIPWITWITLTMSPIPGNYTHENVAADVKRAGVLLSMFVSYGSDDDLVELNRRANEQFGRDVLSLCKMSVKHLPELAKQVPPGSLAASDVALSLQIFVDTGAWLHHALDLPYDADTYGATIVLNSLARRRHASSPAITAYEAFLRLWYAERCWAPGCPETFASAQRKFNSCSGCKRVSYCSKACQTKAWKHERVPHRAICPTLRYVGSATRLEAKPQAERKFEFEALCKRKKVREEALADITVHVNNLLKELPTAPESTAAVQTQSD